MSRATNRSADEVLTDVSSSLTRWVLGIGLLSLHATVFTITMIGMVLWNIYDTPDDLWVADVFRRWGAVLAFHAIVVAAGWTAWRLMRAERQAMTAAQTSWTPPAARRAPLHVFDAQGVSQPANPGVGHRYADSAHKAEEAAKRAWNSSTMWSAAFARRTRQAVTNTATKWTSRIGHGEGAPPAVSDPTHTWPVGPVQHRAEDHEFISRFGGNGTTPAPNDHTDAAGQGSDIVLNLSGIVYPTVPQSDSTPTISKEPGQTWVEAATSIWHAPLETEKQPAQDRQNGHREPTSESSTSANGDQPSTPE